MVRAALGRPAGDRQVSPVVPDQVAAALRGLPSHGWTQGMFGRRDRCLLVLSPLAGVPYKLLATITVDDITSADCVATITPQPVGGHFTLSATPCCAGPCTIARWLRVLDLAITKISTNVLKAAVGKADILTHESPHLCRSTKKTNGATTTAPLFPPINQWGALRSHWNP